MYYIHSCSGSVRVREPDSCIYFFVCYWCIKRVERADPSDLGQSEINSIVILFQTVEVFLCEIVRTRCMDGGAGCAITERL